MKKQNHLIIIIFLLLSAKTQSEIKLTPQLIVDKLLSKTPRFQEIYLNSKEADLPLELIRNRFDFIFSADTKYNIFKTQTIADSSDIKIERLEFTSSLKKKNMFGTFFSANYNKILQDTGSNSVVNNYNSLGTSQNSFSLHVKQDLLQNSFGAVDRAEFNIALIDKNIAKYTQEEELENLILEAMELFWLTYTAKESLQSAIDARKKYEELVVVVSKKANIGYSQPGELEKVKAEFYAQDQNVKLSSENYLTQLDKLFELIDFKTEKNLIFEVPIILPELPQSTKPDLNNIRLVKIKKLTLEKTSTYKKSSKFANMPALNLNIKVSYSGVGSTNDKSLSEMASLNHPDYYVGFNFENTLTSSKARGYSCYAVSYGNSKKI